MTIVESIKCVLQNNHSGLTSKQIYDEIIRRGLYIFGAENPVGVVNAQLRRRCAGLDFPTAYPVKFFEIAGYEGKKIKFRLLSEEKEMAAITTPKIPDSSELLPEEKIKSALQEHFRNMRQQVFNCVLNNSPQFFEHLVIDLLLEMGYGKDKNSGVVTGRSHDGGIDGSKYSSNIFTLNTFYTANKRIFKVIDAPQKAEKLIHAFWSNVVENMREWNEMDNGELSKKSLREDYITTQGLIILALGRLGEFYCANPKIDMVKSLKGLRKIDWLRNNEECWMNRAIKPNGKINRNEQGIFLTYIQIKRLLSLPISDEELKKENKMRG